MNTTHTQTAAMRADELAQLACMVRLLGFAAEACRTLMELEQAGLAYPKELARLQALVDGPKEWQCHVPNLGDAADVIADRLQFIADQTVIEGGAA